eukprot:scaffold34966_cov30-Tisochrysis_lutea.AAC.6
MHCKPPRSARSVSRPFSPMTQRTTSRGPLENARCNVTTQPIAPSISNELAAGPAQQVETPRVLCSRCNRLTKHTDTGSLVQNAKSSGSAAHLNGSHSTAGGIAQICKVQAGCKASHRSSVRMPPEHHPSKRDDPTKLAPMAYRLCPSPKRLSNHCWTLPTSNETGCSLIEMRSPPGNLVDARECGLFGHRNIYIPRHLQDPLLASYLVSREAAERAANQRKA